MNTKVAKNNNIGAEVREKVVTILYFQEAG